MGYSSPGKILAPVLGTNQAKLVAGSSVGNHGKRPTISFGITSCKELPAAAKR